MAWTQKRELRGGEELYRTRFDPFGMGNPVDSGIDSAGEESISVTAGGRGKGRG